MLSCAIAAKSDKVRLAFALKFGKSLDCRRRQIFVQESPLLSSPPQGEDQAFPNFSLAILGDFNGLQRKKFGNRSPRILLSVYPSVASQPAIASYVAHYNRSGGFEEEFCSIKQVLRLRLRRISSLISLRSILLARNGRRAINEDVALRQRQPQPGRDLLFRREGPSFQTIAAPGRGLKVRRPTQPASPAAPRR
jgi:hypothetical protein